MPYQSSKISKKSRSTIKAASPAELVVGEDAIVEVKCPIQTHNITIEKAIVAGKLTFFRRERMNKKITNFVLKVIGINTKHHWYSDTGAVAHNSKKVLLFRFMGC